MTNVVSLLLPFFLHIVGLINKNLPCTQSTLFIILKNIC